MVTAVVMVMVVEVKGEPAACGGTTPAKGLLVVLGEWCRRFRSIQSTTIRQIVDWTYRATEPFMITSIFRDTVLVLEVW